MNERSVGWVFVGVQIVLLGALIFLPGGDDWPTPVWLHRVGTAINVAGIALVVVAALGLGSSLTPTPVPRVTLTSPRAACIDSCGTRSTPVC